MVTPKLSMRSVVSLTSALSHPYALLGRRIGGKLREQVVLHVSSANSCVVCSAVHGLVGRVEGLSSEQIAQARSGTCEAPDERTRAALRYAELRTSAQEAFYPEDVATFERCFSAEEQREVRAVVDLFTFANRFNNTWEAVLPGASWRRRFLGI